MCEKATTHPVWQGPPCLLTNGVLFLSIVIEDRTLEPWTVFVSFASHRRSPSTGPGRKVQERQVVSLITNQAAAGATMAGKAVAKEAARARTNRVNFQGKKKKIKRNPRKGFTAFPRLS